MKAQDLYTLGLKHPDSFKLAGREFIMHVTNPAYAYTKDNKIMLWIGESKAKLTESHLIWDMEITDIVQEKEIVSIEYEVLKSNELLSLSDIVEYEDGSINIVKSNFPPASGKLWVVRDMLPARVLRRVK